MISTYCLGQEFSRTDPATGLSWARGPGGQWMALDLARVADGGVF